MLFFKELKKTVFSIPFVILILGLLSMVYSQGVLTFNADDKITEPQPGMASYGTKIEENPEVIMPAAFDSLYWEFMGNSYATYPIGFIKRVTLSAEKQQEMAGLLAALSGGDAQEIYGAYQKAAASDHSAAAENGDGITLQVGGDGSASLQVSGDDSASLQVGGGENGSASLQVGGNGGTLQIGSNDGEGSPQASDAAAGADGAGGEGGEDVQLDPAAGDSSESAGVLSVDASLDYDTFLELMAKAADLIGPGSDYEEDALLSFSKVPKTYENAMADYELIRDADHFSGAHARLFTDYALCVLSVLPVFMGVAMALKDKYSQMSPQVYTRKISSVRLILTRYGAILAAVGAVALIFAYISNISAWKLYPGEHLDVLAPLKYTLGWIMPSVMVSAAVGMLLTELTGTPIAIVVQGLWWFVDLNTGIHVSGDYPLWQLSPRHNSLGNAASLLERFPSLAANRIFMAAAAVALIILCMLVVELKRKGRLGSYGRFQRLIGKKA